ANRLLEVARQLRIAQVQVAAVEPRAELLGKPGLQELRVIALQASDDRLEHLARINAVDDERLQFPGTQLLERVRVRTGVGRVELGGAQEPSQRLRCAGAHAGSP